ncbi:hypothetical protein [Tolypothrix sp. VBCCA 56010]|uniref:hypothetical protein n=1 Tax=Tolypothrix sp. VBCCA 56010 TaxID=3137731 RepID=UPI003D7C93DB
MQAFKDAPIWVKILMVVVVGIFGIAGYMGIEPLFNKQSQGSPSESSKSVDPEFQEINITVQNKRDASFIRDVEVQIVSDGPPTLKKTDSIGYLEIEIPTRKTIKIILNKKGYKSETYYVNLQTDPKTTKPFYMEPEELPTKIELQKNPSSKGQLPFQELELGGLDLKQVCKDQYPNNDAKPIQIKFMNESSWRCHVNINMDKACNKKYPGSVAHIDQAGSWKCYRKVITTPQSSY